MYLQVKYKAIILYAALYMLLIFTGPSCSGKSSILKLIMQNIKNTYFVISTTSRPKRNSETDGKEYFFVSKNEFIDKINNDEFVEYTKLYDNYYGTEKKNLLKILEQKDNIVLFDIDHYGRTQIKNNLSDQHKIIDIFIKPPSISELRSRMLKRAQNTEQDIEKRIKSAEIELKYAKYYKYEIINNKLDKTVEEIIDIILKEQKQI